jgi:hypothetical protein
MAKQSVEYHIKTGLIRENGDIPATITAPLKVFEAELYACQNPAGFNLEIAIADLVFPNLIKDVPYGSDTYVKSIDKVTLKDGSIKIKCIIAPGEISKILCTDVPGNFNFRTTGNGGKYDPSIRPLTTRELYERDKKLENMLPPVRGLYDTIKAGM